MAMIESVSSGGGRSSDAGAKEPRSARASSPAAEISAIVARLKAAHRREGAPDYTTRLKHLEKLERTVLARKDDIARAISSDFGHRSVHETLAGEVMLIVTEIRHARAHLHEWMETEPRDVSWLFMPARAEVVMQPLGVVGIIGPWNYPVQLLLAPLVAALAAGNRVLLKPSELTPKTAELVHTLIVETFAPDHVTVVTGGVEVAEAFAQQPFDHLLFTGSTRVGKSVMRAAAENLVPVTLELGGKSPAIVAARTNLAEAAQKIMFGKLFNAGQTCIAPDYALVPRDEVEAFVAQCKLAVARMYPTLEQNPDYTSIVNDRHLARLRGYLEDATRRGAKVVSLAAGGETPDAESRKLEPTLVLSPEDEMMVMQDEIFGPILPIVPYEKLEDAIAFVNDRPRPLALYYFDDDGKRIARVLRETIAGGVAINDTLLHCAQDDLPFGGVGASGMGHYHGREGFETFTKKKPVFYQSRLSGTRLLAPPYKGRVNWFFRMFLGK